MGLRKIESSETDIIKEVVEKMPELKQFSLIEVFFFWERFSYIHYAQFLVANVIDKEEGKEEFRREIKEEFDLL